MVQRKLFGVFYFISYFLVVKMSSNQRNFPVVDDN